MAYAANETLLGTYAVKEESEIQLKLVETKSGENYVDLRTYWTPPGDDEKRPTKKGVRLHVENLESLIDDLKKADKGLKKKGK